MLAVDRQQRSAAARCGRAVIRSPAVTSASLFASATVLPASTAAMTGAEARAADDRGDDKVRVACSSLDQSRLSRRRPTMRAGQQPSEVAEARFIRNDRKRRAGTPRYIGKCFDIRCRGHRSDREAVGIALDQVERRFADRPGRAKDCDPACHANPSSCAAAVSTATGTRPSSRSSTPPCPGSHAPESLTPALRFIALSNKSPPWAAAANEGRQR